MIYCVSDIHGCYEEFMALLKAIQFVPDNDKVYVLGDVIDRGPKPIDCLRHIMHTKGIRLIMGNHEQMMLDYYDYHDRNWKRNGCGTTTEQLKTLSKDERAEIFEFLRKRPYYKTLSIDGGMRYFLSHSGLNPEFPLANQEQRMLLWRRTSFIEHKALERHICIFGHTPTFHLHDDGNCSVWFDEKHGDKICIDCGCVYGGALAALRLNDGEVFYVKRVKKS